MLIMAHLSLFMSKRSITFNIYIMVCLYTNISDIPRLQRVLYEYALLIN
jgi:hypothetical protein